MPLISAFLASSHPAALGRRAATSTATYSALPRPSPHGAGQATGPIVCLTLRVATLDTLALRRALHRALGNRIDIYTLSVDTRLAVTTLQLQSRRAEVAALMDAVMAGVPQAEFGPLRPASQTVLH